MVSFWDAPVAVARPGPNCAALLKCSPHWAPVPGRHAATPNCGPPVRRPSRPRRKLPRSPRQLEVSRPGRATIEQDGDRRAALRVAAHDQRPPLAGIATHPWVIASQEEDAARQPFWLDIDPFGDGSRYLVTAKPATVGHSARRPPEPHPGLLEQPTTVGIRLQRAEHGLFTDVRNSTS
jgi:hypothetical protein